MSCYNLGKITPLLSKSQHVRQRVFRTVRCNQIMGNLGEKFLFITNRFTGQFTIRLRPYLVWNNVVFHDNYRYRIRFFITFFLLVQYQLFVHDDWPMIDLSRVPQHTTVPRRMVGNKYPCVRFTCANETETTVRVRVACTYASDRSRQKTTSKVTFSTYHRDVRTGRGRRYKCIAWENVCNNLDFSNK